MRFKVVLEGLDKLTLSLVTVAPIGEHPPILRFEGESLGEQSHCLTVLALPVQVNSHLIVGQTYLIP